FFFIATYILSFVLSPAVVVMLAWHLWGVACGETAVEPQDHGVFAKRAKERSDV
ncbi:hypothetical protein F5J12DRAFT_705774, partial [Pisolithus orientalis]|uniref:uncharacterized protein n=1 Tax=Pisolithus orientalis TaxID=936130 RepID=UPI00222587DA